MKKLITTVALIVFSSSSVAAIEALSEKDLMAHFVSELETNVVGKAVDRYDADAISASIKQHHLYLMLCSNKIATNKCDQAKEELSNLNRALEVHLNFQKDLAKMWNANSSLNQTKPE